MWELLKLHSFGRFSIRSILLLVTAIVVASFTLGTTPTTYAATDATWNADGSGLLYQGNLYTLQSPIATGSSTGLPSGTKDYQFTQTGSNGQQEADLITFAPNSDPTSATSGTFTSYTYTPPDGFSNPSAAKSISITPQTQQQNKAQGEQCNIQGVGWIVCPVSNFLSTAMDWLYGILSDFLVVQPVSNDQQNSLYKAWSVMRNFANVTFVIAFLVVIYSQLTNLGLSNYGVKKMLPRLIVASILVNVSYWICSLGVDISNILGTSVQGIFDAIRNGLTSAGQANTAATAISFSNVTSFVLSGGTAVAAGLVGWSTFSAGAGAAIFLLLPILVSTILACLVALLILAARQALIVLMIILSPLAFVAYLLPNTEKFYKQWFEVFTTMLMIFPMFALVFSGAQLAGSAIIQNASSLVMIILGMGVKVAPVAITPFLIRIGGGILKRFAGLTNNPNKGLIDRTRNWSKERADQFEAKQKAKDNPGFGLARRAQRKDYKKRQRAGMQKAHEGRADANWANSMAYSDIQQYDMDTGRIKEIGESNAQIRYATAQRLNSATQALDISARAAKLKLDVSKAQVDANWEEIEAGSGVNILPAGGVSAASLSVDALRRHTDQTTALAQAIRSDAIQKKVEARRTHSAEEVLDEHYESAMLSSADLQRQAGGIAPRGADSALAAAVASSRKTYGDNVKEQFELMKHFNLSGSQRQDIATLRADVTLTDSHGNVRTFSKDNVHAVEAAISAQLSGQGSFKEQREIISLSGSTLRDYRTTIGDDIAANKISEKAQFLSGQTIDDVKQGNIRSMADLDKAVARNIAEGKIKAAQFANMDPDAVEQIVRVAKAGGTPDRRLTITQLRELSLRANEVIDNPTISAGLSKKTRDHLDEIKNRWP